MNEITLKFENSEEYNRFLILVTMGMIECVDSSNAESYESRKKFFDTYVNVRSQLPIKE